MFKRFVLKVVCSALFLACDFARAGTDPMLAKTDGDVIARIHFAGVTKISSGNSKLTDIANLPETTQLREQTVQKLATTPFRFFKSKIANGNTNDYSMLLRPLVEDLLNEESYTEIRGPQSAMPETMIAIRLNSNRAQMWRDGLSMVLSAWTGVPVKPINGDGFTGWELRKHHDPNLIRFLRMGDWVLFGWGQDELRLQSGFVQRIKTQKRPVETFKEGWLDAMVDWPTFMKYHPFTPPGLLPAQLPKMHLSVETRKNDVRPKLVMQFPQALDLNLEPWRFPTNLIRNPLGSFTAVRGVAPWFNQLQVVRQTQPPTVPNQLAFWSSARLPNDSSVSAPMANASNYLAQVGPRLAPVMASFLAQRSMPSKVYWTNHTVAWLGMPFVMPYLTSAHLPSGDFLFGGTIPPVRRTNATLAPPQLFNEINSKPNLVCYSWENTEERSKQWLSIHQIYLMDNHKALASSSAPGFKWLRAAEKAEKLGSTTEITLTAPDELTLLRNGSIGLNGLELVMLEYWVDAPGFPLQIDYHQMTLHDLKSLQKKR